MQHDNGWIQKLTDAGGGVTELRYVPQLADKKYGFYCNFSTGDPSENTLSVLKSLRDKFARSLRKEGWKVYTEPRSEEGTNEGYIYRYTLTATRDI
jgi:hypothetical protein